TGAGGSWHRRSRSQRLAVGRVVRILNVERTVHELARRVSYRTVTRLLVPVVDTADPLEAAVRARHLEFLAEKLEIGLVQVLDHGVLSRVVVDVVANVLLDI